MKEKVSELLVQQNFDSVVCDFLASAPNIPSLADCVLFQHNVETVLWQRHHQAAKGPIARKLYCSQAARMYEFERSVCRQVRHVIAVSMQDAQRMQSMFEINHVSDVQTGVDVEYFRRAAGHEELFDLVFVGSMDWSANIDGVEFFLREVLPLIHLERPETRLAVVGRQPPRTVLEAGMSNPRVTVTGTVDDVRPYLWGSQVSIVPLRIGGGTRLKIYESMAAGVPVVSTSVGAEGLAVEDGRNILIGDTPEAFARHCLTLLNERDRRDRLSAEAGRLVSQRFSWEQSAREFETILMRNAVGAAT